MSVARVTEISSTSEKSFEDAINQGIQRATATLRNVKSAWVKEQEVQVEGNRIVGDVPLPPMFSKYHSCRSTPLCAHVSRRFNSPHSEK